MSVKRARRWKKYALRNGDVILEYAPGWRKMRRREREKGMADPPPARGKYKSGIIKQFHGNRNKTRRSKFQSFSPDVAWVRERLRDCGGWRWRALAFGKPLQTMVRLLNRALLFSCRRACVSCTLHSHRSHQRFRLFFDERDFFPTAKLFATSSLPWFHRRSPPPRRIN